MPKPKQDPAAEFERLLRPLIPLLYRQAFRWTTARDQAEDLVQEVLLRLYPRLDELARVERLQPWVLRVMYRIFVDQYRRASNSPVRPMHEVATSGEQAGGNPEDHFPDASPQPEQLLETALLGERLTVAWSLLGEDQRVVVSMHDIEGYRLEEISGMLDVPVGTVKSRLHRARARLRALLVMEPSCAAVRVSQRGEEI